MRGYVECRVHKHAPFPVAIVERACYDVRKECLDRLARWQRFAAADSVGDAEGTRLWWERMQAKKPTRHNADYWIARSAFLWSEHRLPEAREAWEKGNALVQQLPHAGAYETDRDQFALLQKELELATVAG